MVSFAIVIVKNLTNNAILSKDALLCSGAISKAVGLMFSTRQKNALVFNFRRKAPICLHMLFVFYPIDVIFLDEKLEVVDKKERFMPFSFYKSRKAVHAIELACGVIKKTGTSLGDRIQIKK